MEEHTMNLGQRIIVMGSSGSGKSTLARQLGERLDLPVVHMDTLSWQPGWVETPKDELEQAILIAAAQPKWVIEGNYQKWGLDERLARADTVILLDLNRFTCLYRAFKRRVMYHGRSRPCMTQGCNERITWWLITWIWGYPRRARGKTLTWLAEIPPPKQVFHLKGRRTVRKFLQIVETDANPPVLY